MNISQIQTHLLQRETELQRNRTRKLATAQWSAVIEVEAKIEECSRLRQWIAQEVEASAKVPGITPQ